MASIFSRILFVESASLLGHLIRKGKLGIPTGVTHFTLDTALLFIKYPHIAHNSIFNETSYFYNETESNQFDQVNAICLLVANPTKYNINGLTQNSDLYGNCFIKADIYVSTLWLGLV